MCREAEAQVHLGELELDQDVPVRMDVRNHIEEADPGEELYVEQQEEFLLQQEHKDGVLETHLESDFQSLINFMEEDNKFLEDYSCCH